MELKKYKLGDILDVTRGASLSGKYYSTEGVYVRLTCGNFDYKNNCFKENKSKENIYYTGNFKSEFLLEEGDIITPLTEQAIGLLGSTAIIPESGKYIQSQDVAKIVCNKTLLDKNFAFYLISSDIVKQQLSAAAQQTKIRHTSPDKIKSCTVWIPELSEQKRIGRLLRSIDYKIEFNRAINHYLEAMAKQLYDYWFVQFDFPDENGRPYKSSGGKMVWNEKLKRDIPEGWICCQLDEIESNIVTGKTPSTTDESYFGGEIPFITIDDIRQARYVFQTTRTLSEKGANTQSKKYLPVGALCCSCIGTVGLLGFAGKIGQTNQQINSIVFKQDYNREYLYFSLHLYFSHASAKVGNILPNMSKDDFSKIPLLYPTKSLVMKYHQTTQNIFHQIENSITEINILTKQRDELLPLLMNGQVSVNNDLLLG
ncbi:MAG: restriction endonuclease subunit S [Candidatus Cryptobacteroides sp.]